MTFYKSISSAQSHSFYDIIPPIDDFANLQKLEAGNIEYDNETNENIKQQFSIVLNQSFIDASYTFDHLTQMILTAPKVCIQFIMPAHFEYAIYLISKKEHCQNGISFLNTVLDTYPHFSQYDNFIALLDKLFKNIAIFFSQKAMDNNIKCLENILSKSINNSVSRDIFIKSQSMKELKKHIKSVEDYENDSQINQNDLFFFYLKIVKILFQIHPIPTIFDELVYPLQIIANTSGNNSVLALQLLIEITKYSSIDIFQYIIQYDGNETTYIENISSFLASNDGNIEKKKYSLKFLSVLAKKYNDKILEKMNDTRVLFETKKALNDQNDIIIIEALKLFLSWSQNADKYKKNLFDQICRFNITELCRNSSFKVKDLLMNLVFYLSQNATPSQLHCLIDQEFLSIASDNLDDTSPDLSLKILQSLQSVSDRCQSEYPDLINMILQELNDIQFNNPFLNEQLFNLLQRINMMELV